MLYFRHGVVGGSKYRHPARPTLIRGKSEKGLELMANVEILPDQEELPSILGSIGTSLEMHVSHPVDLPDAIEAAALIWRRP